MREVNLVGIAIIGTGLRGLRAYISPTDNDCKTFGSNESYSLPSPCEPSNNGLKSNSHSSPKSSWNKSDDIVIV